MHESHFPATGLPQVPSCRLRNCHISGVTALHVWRDANPYDMFSTECCMVLVDPCSHMWGSESTAQVAATSPCSAAAFVESLQLQSGLTVKTECGSEWVSWSCTSALAACSAGVEGGGGLKQVCLHSMQPCTRQSQRHTQP